MKISDLPPQVLESLESRLAPAGLVSLTLSASGALTITGDADHNQFTITENAGMWSVADLSGGLTKFSLNGSAAQDTASFAAPVSVAAKLGAGNDDMTLVNTTINKTFSVDTGDGNDVVDFTSARFIGTSTVAMGNGDDYFTGGGDLFFGKGLSVTLGKGANTFDINADTLVSNGNISATAGGTVLEGQAFLFQTGAGQINGGLTLRTTTGSFTDFNIGLEAADSLVVTKAMTLQSVGGEDVVTLVGDLTVGGLLAMRLGNGNNSVVTTDADQLSSYGLTYVGGTGDDTFVLEAREVIVTGSFSFSAGAGTNKLDLFTSEYLGVTKALTYTGGIGQDTMIVDGPEVYVGGVVGMAASNGTNVFAIDAVLGDLGGVKFTGGTGYDLVDIGQPDGNSTLIEVFGAVSISTGAGRSDIQILRADIRGNLSIASAVALGVDDEVRLFDSDFRGTVSVNLTGGADSYVEVRDGIFDRNVTISTGNGNDEVRFDTETATNEASIYSWFDGNVRVNLGAGDDQFYAGSDLFLDTVGNDFNGYMDVYGGTGFDTAYFMDSLAYNNGFNGPLPWASSVEDLA